MTKKNFQKFSLLGAGIDASLSPIVHDFIFKRDSIDASYGILDIPESLINTEFIARIASEYRGFNVTIPYKRTIHALLENRSGIANLTGCVNTVDIRTESCLVGHNTDITGIEKGFLNPLSKKMLLPSKMVLLGGGGAARSMIYAFLNAHRNIKSENTREIIVFLRNPLKGRDLEELSFSILNSPGFNKYEALLRVYRWDDEKITNELRYGGIIVNATPRGSVSCDEKQSFDFEKNRIDGDGIAAFDMVYNPCETPFLESAASVNAVCIGGLGMLVYQALASLEIWFQREFSDRGIFDDLLSKGFHWFKYNID